MRKSALFVVTGLSSAMALGAPALSAAGPLGGGLGGLGGGLGGSFSSPLGGLNGSLNGRLANPDLDAEQRAAADARARARRAAKTQVVQPATATVSGVVTNATPVVTSTDRTVSNRVRVVGSSAQTIVAAAPVVGLPPVQTRVIRERQGAALVEGGVVVLSEPASYIYMDRQAEALQRDLVGTGIEVRREGKTIVLEMPSDVTFAFNKSDIRPRFYTALDAVARTLNQYPATYVDVIGHTDAIGSAGYNQVLSERRAQAVAGFIEQREEIPARFYVAGRGKFEPVASNATIQGRAANRRVEILLHPYVGG